MQLGKPRFKTPKAAKTHARVLAAAVKLFGKRGFEGTSMRDVAAQAKLGLGALYYHFSSKDALVQGFYEQVNAEIREAFERTSNKPESLAEQLRQLLDLKLTHLEPHRELFRVLLKQTLDPLSPLSPLGSGGQATRQANIELFERILDRSRPDMPAPDKHQYANALWTAHMGLLLYWAMDPSPKQRRTHELLDKLMNAIRFSEAFARMPAFANFERQAISALAALVPETNMEEQS